jgi:hydroxypyruvate reductase
LHVAGAQYDLLSFDRIIVVGAGKATARMAMAIESLLGEKIDSGLIVVKEGHSAVLSTIEQVESSHPVPGAAGVAATLRILEMAREADERTLFICLMSGGASALQVAPVAGITLQDKQETTRLLLNAGASISELNAVRKHLSMVKGGQLAQAACPAQVVTLILSDVIGDQLDVIASGPTAADKTTYADAWAVITKFGLQEKLPARVASHLQYGIDGKVAETVKANDLCLTKTHNSIIANLHEAMIAAQEQSERLGWDTRVISETLQGEAREAARFLARTVQGELGTMKSNERRCLLCGGETTVNVRGMGKGGRNQEFALAFALEMEGCQGVTFLCAGTDGTDGPTDAAGAMVDGNTASSARHFGIDPISYLEDNDSYTFFQQLDTATGAHSHFKTGATGTNVMDLQIVLLHKDSSR